MKTIISHFHNEEYLLPFWLKHHKKYFDHGILIDYNSNDNSCDIIRDICPKWDIIKSRNNSFEAISVDNEVTDIERNINDWRITLNTTEFIIGDFNKLDNISDNNSIYIPECVMVDSIDKEYTEINGELIYDRYFGLSPFNGDVFKIRKSRRLSNYFSNYPTIGRHFNEINTNDFIILWYGYSPFNEKTINRKLNIQTQIPNSDKIRGFGAEHIVDINSLKDKFKEYQKDTKNLKDLIEKYGGINFQ
jgi:hypothetical protein